MFKFYYIELPEQCNKTKIPPPFLPRKTTEPGLSFEFLNFMDGVNLSLFL